MSIYDYKVKKVDGSEVSLKEYEGKALLVVNTATGCGYTPQYEGLEELYKKYQEQGLEILDFPSNQFLEQAPGTNEEIQSFCKINFGTEFETFAKIDVNGDNAHPLYTYLKQQQPADTDNGGMPELIDELKGLGYTSKSQDDIQWNFTKFLVDRKGNVVGRFAPPVTPKELEAHIEKVL